MCISSNEQRKRLCVGGGVGGVRKRKRDNNSRSHGNCFLLIPGGGYIGPPAGYWEGHRDPTIDFSSLNTSSTHVETRLNWFYLWPGAQMTIRGEKQPGKAKQLNDANVDYSKDSKHWGYMGPMSWTLWGACRIYSRGLGRKVETIEGIPTRLLHNIFTKLSERKLITVEQN